MSANITLTEAQRDALRAMVDSAGTSTRMATRARIVLTLERQWKVKDVAEALGVSAPTVRLWRSRFLEEGIDGLSDRQDSGASDAELQRLLDAAERTVSQRGFCATRIADIAVEANVSPSLIMYYFDSRQETLVRAMLHANQRAAAEFEARLLEEPGAAVNRLALFIERVLPVQGSRLDEYLLELDLLAHARQFPDLVPIWDSYQQRWIAVLAAIIEDGIVEGAFGRPRATPETLAQSVLALIDGFGYQMAVGSSIVDRATMTAAIAGFLADNLGVEMEELRPAGAHVD